MFYLIGLGLDLESISKDALNICKKAARVYLENYTVEFPYNIEKLEDVLGKRVVPLTRIVVEEEKFVGEAKKKNIVLLVYGSPLTATTHISLLLECVKKGISWRVLHNASILDAICESGLQIYKFGKTASMPKWQENYKPKSFVDSIKDNKKIKAHTLILVDLGLTFPEALRQLGRACRKKIKLGKIIVCSQLGTKEGRIYYSSLDELFGAEVFPPFCFILPSDLHFLEKEFLEKVKEKI
jgi:diphthine synthase